MGEESGSILWPQSLGVARLLPAGKREFGEISAADVPDNTVERQHQQGMCLPDENVLPPPPTTELQGALPGAAPERARAQGPPSSWVGHQQAPVSSSLCLTGFPAILGRQAGTGATHWVFTHTQTQSHTKILPVP